MKAMRVALWNASGLENLGDRLIDEVTRRELRRRLPNVQLTTFTPWPSSYCTHRLHIDKHGLWPGHNDFDAIVIVGGALITGPPFFDPAGQFFLLGPYPERFQDDALVIWNAMCSDRQLLAPTKANWRAYVHEAVSRVDVLTVRNSSTADFLRSCDVQRHVEIVPDVAVLADAPRQVTAAKSSQLRIGYAPGRPVFPQTFLDEMGRMALLNMPSANPAVVEMSLWADMFPFEEDVYTDRLADSVRALLSLGELELFGFGAMYGDPQVAALVASKVGRARHLRLGDAGGENALERIRALDCLIAFRLHACISALVVGTPFVAIDLYATKEGKTTKLLEFVR